MHKKPWYIWFSFAGITFLLFNIAFKLRKKDFDLQLNFSFYWVATCIILFGEIMFTSYIYNILSNAFPALDHILNTVSFIAVYLESVYSAYRLARWRAKYL
ncbi:hypothetical protein V6615_13440 [Oscillospiraceae bacterium PP1C4]